MRVGIEDRVGTVWYNGLQIEKGEIANNVNLVPNAAFSDNRGGLPFGWNYYTEEHTGDGLTADGHFRVCGKPGETAASGGKPIWPAQARCTCSAAGRAPIR